jgi:hypothetical protein
MSIKQTTVERKVCGQVGYLSRFPYEIWLGVSVGSYFAPRNHPRYLRFAIWWFRLACRLVLGISVCVMSSCYRLLPMGIFWPCPDCPVWLTGFPLCVLRRLWRLRLMPVPWHGCWVFGPVWGSPMLSVGPMPVVCLLTPAPPQGIWTVAYLMVGPGWSRG